MDCVAADFKKYKAKQAGLGNALRAAKLSQVQTRQDALAWAKDLRHWYRETIGELVQIEKQQRTFHGEIRCEGYKIEKWLFEVFPGTMAAANLYVPDAVNADGVALLAPLGHWIVGKSMPDYQNLAAYMASHGVTVLVYEHAGLGERRELWDEQRGMSLVGDSGTSEHCRIGDAMIATGIQPANYFLSEVQQARDFLASFDCVAADKIGISGASGGGCIASQAACYFDDLAFSIPACILRGEKVGSDGCHEQVTWREGLDGVASFDLLTSMLPKPVMVVTEHIGDASGESMKTLRRLYALAQAPENATDHFQIDDVHGYTHPMIEAVYRFLEKNFALCAPDVHAWQRIRNFTPDELNITKNGFLNRTYYQVSMAQQIINRCPAKGALTKDVVRDLIGLDRLPDLLVQTDGDDNAVAGKTVVKKTMHLVGHVTATEDQISGIDFAPCVAGWYHGHGGVYKSDEASAARWFLSFGASLLAYRVKQLLRFVQAHGRAIECIQAEGKWALVLLLAQVVSDLEYFPKIELTHLLLSYRQTLSADLNLLPASMYIPGILAYGDIDDLLGLCGSAVTVACRTDAFGRIIAA